MKSNIEKTMYYTEGNAARQMQAAPDYREERRRWEEEEEREAELRRKKKIARKNQEMALRTNRSYVLFLSICAIMLTVFAGVYIKIQSDITARMKKISNLESQVTTLRAENDERLKRMNTIVDLGVIKDTAINELGMFYATSEQIIYYTVNNDDYMNQYIGIPEK